MTNYLVSRYRRLGDYFSANWPLLWKSQVHLCLFFSLLGVGFAGFLSLSHVNAMVLGGNKLGVVNLHGFILGAALSVLAVAALAWIQATKRALPLRSMRHSRYSPRFTYVLLGVAGILGGFIGSLILLGLEPTYFPPVPPDPSTTPLPPAPPDVFIASVLFLLLGAVVLFVMLVNWYSFREVLSYTLIVLGIVVFVFVPFAFILVKVLSLEPIVFAGVDVSVDTVVYGLIAIVSLPCLAALVLGLSRGARSQSTRSVLIFSMVLVPLALMQFSQIGLGALSGAMGLVKWVESVGWTWEQFYLTFVAPTIVVIGIAGVELMCWLSAKLELLPERR